MSGRPVGRSASTLPEVRDEAVEAAPPPAWAAQGALAGVRPPTCSACSGSPRPRRRRPAAPPAARPLRIAVLVPAHDEEDGVAATVASLLASDHPSDAHRVVVIADNCSGRHRAARRRRRRGGVGAPRSRPPRQGPGAGLGARAAARRARPARGRRLRRRRLPRGARRRCGRCSDAIAAGAPARPDRLPDRQPGGVELGGPPVGGLRAHAPASAVPARARPGCRPACSAPAWPSAPTSCARCHGRSFSVTEDIEHHVRLVEHGP